MTARPHGYARYKLDGCRCYTCGWANAQHCDAREHSIRRGTWQPFVDATPAREHVLQLKACGFGDRRIAELAGLDRKAVRTLLLGRVERGTPPPAQIRPATAAALLNVDATFDNLPDSAVVDATGTLRRLRALVAAGWPQAQLAAQLGVTATNFSAALRRDRTLVRSARAVRDLYDELSTADPREAGVDARAYSRARNYAASHTWAPVGAWDEETIDDPAAEPEWTGECGTSAGYFIHQRIGITACSRCRAARNSERRAARAAA